MTNATPVDIRARIVQFTAQPVPYDSPELGTVYIRRVTLGELDAMQKAALATVEPGKPAIPTTVRLLARFLGDASGKPLFNLDTPADLDVLLAMPVSAAADLLRRGNSVNQLEEEAAAAKKP